MLEKLLFSSMAMPGETVRIALALLGTALAVYFDVFNNRNVPNNLLYGFLAAAVLANVVFFDADIVLYSAALTAILFAFGFLLYRTGQLGGADLFVVCSITLLLPIHPSFLDTPFNYPLIFSTLLYSGVAFAVFSVFYFARLIVSSSGKPKANPVYLLLLLPYFFFAYIFINASFFSPVYFFIASVLLLSTVFFLVYRKSINEAMMEKVKVSSLEGEEDVLVNEKMKRIMEDRGIGPVLGKKEVSKLREAGVKEVWIYSRLPPFLPFLLIGLLGAIFLGDWIFLVFY